jgi:type IV secretory pathway TraG/TraD family ATPase VirD4
MGKSSVAIHVYLRSVAQAKDAYGESVVRSMWDNAEFKVIAGGAGNLEDLEEVSKLIGNARRPSSMFSAGNTDALSPVLTAEELRTMEFGTAVVIGRDARPVEVRLKPWWRRKDGGQLRAAKEEVDQLLRRYAQTAGVDRRVKDYVASAHHVKPATVATLLGRRQITNGAYRGDGNRER